MWHERTAEARERGDLVVVGLIQEQHPDRCRLFLDWQNIDWPILVDSLNRSGVSAVPLVWAIDEHGVLRHTRPTPEWVLGTFLETAWSAPQGPSVEPLSCNEAEKHYLEGRYTESIEAATKHLAEAATDASMLFLLGCAHRARYDAHRTTPTHSGMHDSDFQAAIDAWSRAIEAAPSNYIYRRRIQQYGPRLDKPYPFYDWIAEARDALRKRGADVPRLVVEPEGSELATPVRTHDLAETDDREPDAKHAIAIDELAIAVHGVVAPNPVRVGSSFRLYWKLRANEGVKLDAEADAPVAWIELPNGFTATRKKRMANPVAPTRTPVERTIEYEVHVDAAVEPGSHTIRGYALVPICDDATGTCKLVRRSLSREIVVRAPK
ncbi:MAG: hypothetical protein H6832_02110 [Planctomycetes bacterium]|nr:hypothetical protein [Planctomycetota bacterium]MCB9917183.1 hypothetical protein [Planctomycetota bacterium]